MVLTTEFKGYSISSSERINLYGAKRRKFINQTTYWGEAGYGALFGKRSGYLEGGIIIGKLMDGPFKNSLIDIRFYRRWRRRISPSRRWVYYSPNHRIWPTNQLTTLLHD